ncbi:MAG TPA: carboxypeptidase regulatory-like domain-containing protein, partial [Candidatus Synoicihabitans sp.]|nr:carboxypeptidase regulatory-like domain-containing protein [Candidatus Synoicihabitans sp.]
MKALGPFLLGCARFTGAAGVFAIFLFAAPPTEGAPAGTITGRVSNAATGEYLRHAAISVRNSRWSTASGAGGAYTLAGVPAGPVELAVSYLGLEPQIVSLVVPAGQTVSL